MKKISPFELRSTLYMPAIKENLKQIITEQQKTQADAIVFCFEDALNVQDIPKGINNLNETFENLDYDPVMNGIIGKGKLPYRFIRVRNIDNYLQLREALNTKVWSHIHGIVIPKFTPSNISEWEKVLQGSRFYIMPTLETEDYYNPAMIQEMFNRLANSSLRERVLVLRLGGNDLLRGLAMKRPRFDEMNMNFSLMDNISSTEKSLVAATLQKLPKPTIYDTPLLFIINQMMIAARYHGFEMTSPVFEYFNQDHLSTFITELYKDKLQGFVGKTAIHPSQCEYINQTFNVREEDVILANDIVNMNTDGGVTNHKGSMIEPTTHFAWAKRLLG